MQPHKLLFLITATALSACSSIPTETEVKDATQAQGPTAPKDWATAVNAENVQIDWLASFDDPTLRKLIQEAQANNRDLQAAAASVERARALAVQAGAALTPAVNLTAGTAQSGSADSSRPTTSSQSLGLQVNWELDIWGRIRAGSQAAVSSAQAAEADYRYAQHSLAAATVKSWLTVIEANLQADIGQETLSVLKETLRIVNVQYKNGLASAQDVALTRSDLASARERLTTIEGSKRDAIRALEILLGRYPSAELEVRHSLPKTPPLPPVGIPAELLERRPDMVAAERRVAAAFNSVAQAKAAKLPSLSLTSTIGGASSSLSSLLDPANIAWQAGTNLLAPIFDGGARQAQVDAATAEQKQALAAYGQAAFTAFAEVESQLDQGVVLSQREADLQEATAAANEAYRIVRLRHKEGETALLDVLTIQQRVISAKSNLASVQRLLLEQRVNLHLALGGDWKI